MSDLGELLRQARAHKQVSLRDAERATRISRQYLAALENHDFDALPPTTYARGIVRNYAQYLGLDPARVLNLFEVAAEERTDRTEFEVVPAIQPMEVRSHWAPNFAIIGFMLIVSAIVFTWLYSAYFQSENAVPAGTIVQPTATELSPSLITQVAKTPTVTPTIDPAVVEATSTSEAETAAILATATAEKDVEISQTPPESAEPEDQESGSTSSADGEHEFTVYVHADVWVEIAMDYSDEPIFQDVIPDGESMTFFGHHMTITSGDGLVVQIFVDGEDWGFLGGEWDAKVTYPW